ncbi:MAG: DUF6382 domain-containing protein [Coriobacteriales bacterium]|nr:DUF6382 domain-containing protein [Coriobacteriales bacterium]
MAISFKEVHNRLQGTTYLTWRTDKRATFDYRQAQRLAKNDQEHLLPFSFIEHKARADLFYFIDATYPLDTFLAQGFSAEQVAILLQQVVRMFDACAAKELLPGNICFDKQYVYVGSQDIRLKFIYLPVSKLQTEGASLLDFLTYLVGNAQPQDDVAARYAFRVLDYLRRQDVFSFVTFKSFLGLDGTENPPGAASNTMKEPNVGAPRKCYRDFVLEQEQGRDCG